ncbi:MAG: peptidoglycan editing factor PgeF [Bacteroidaceae bacterium]|nr:peptidoglycan editing factor PgeF [Bacteroidaceae bacterium]
MTHSEQLHLYPTPHPEVVAFSTTRHGGCGSGAYGTFNCTPYTGDEPAIVHAHQDQLCRLLGISPEHFILPYQTHSCHVQVIDETFLRLSSDARRALLQDTDAIVTALPGTCLCVSTADCVPILLHDTAHGVVAAIHAGWRGTVGGIVSKVLDIMHSTYGTCGSHVQAIIGPCISLAAFEVGIEVYQAFEQAGFPMQQIAQWHPDKEKYHIDLPLVNRLQLLAHDVPQARIHDSRICTYTQHHDYFSARRLGIKSGRILSGILRTT